MQGIVTLAGGRMYGANAYLNCVRLRDMGCELPIEWCYLPGELDDAWQHAITRVPGVTLRELDVTQKGTYTRDAGAWQAKPLAVLESRFTDILFLDADCFPHRDPTFLLEVLHADPYDGLGAILWPDRTTWNVDHPDIPFLQKHFGVEFPIRPDGHTIYQCESGQMVFRMDVARGAIQEALELNRRYEDTYRYLYGDKDTFLVGLLKARVPFLFCPHRPGSFGRGYLHHDLEGNLLFSHLCQSKWALHGRPFVRPEFFPNIDRAKAILAGLRLQLKEFQNALA